MNDEQQGRGSARGSQSAGSDKEKMGSISFAVTLSYFPLGPSSLACILGITCGF